MSDFAQFDDSMGGMLATVGNSTRMAEMNKGITPLFFLQEEPDPAATAAAGTLRIRTMECVRLHTAGDMNSAPVHPVDDKIKERFGIEYSKWKERQNNDFIKGLPLTQWPLASRGLVMELNALNIRSVEDLAAVSDGNIGKVMDGRALRAQAIAWLETNKEAAVAAKYAAENEQLRADIVELGRQVKELAALVPRDEEQRRGPGRPRNAA